MILELRLRTWISLCKVNFVVVAWIIINIQRFTSELTGIYFHPILTGTGFLERRYSLGPRDMIKFQQSFNTIYETYKKTNVFISSACTQGIGNFNPTFITSIAAKHLYHLNSVTKSAIHEMLSKSHFKELSSHPYISLQLRMNDKKYEMSPETWNYITNVSNVIGEVSPYFKKLNISRLYLGNYSVFSSCFSVTYYYCYFSLYDLSCSH